MKEEILKHLFSAKEKLENTKIKSERHALEFLNESIKWMQYNDRG